MALKSDAKYEKELTCGLENDMSNLENIYRKYFRKSQDWDFDGGSFYQGRKCMSLKFTEELSVMATKNDATFEEKLTCRFKIDIRNLTNFDSNTLRSQKFALYWAPLEPSI